MLFDKCTFDNSPAIRSRQITVLHECTPNLAYIWPTCMQTMAYIQSDNHAKSRSITTNHGIRQIIDSEKPNVAKLCLHTECCSERLQLNVRKYDQHGVCGNACTVCKVCALQISVCPACNECNVCIYTCVDVCMSRVCERANMSPRSFH